MTIPAPAALHLNPSSELADQLWPVSIPALLPDPDLPESWERLFRLWLGSLRSPNTRRAYRQAWDQFTGFLTISPWQVSRRDVSAWTAQLRSRGLSPETIYQRLSALSSFYTFASRNLTLQIPGGIERSLFPHNPAAAVNRPRRSPYDKSRALTADQARALLRAIPRHTLQGKRDFALFQAYLLTGRRNSEVRNLRYRDFERDGYRVYYRWNGKGKARRDECPKPVWIAICEYLTSAGKIEPADRHALPAPIPERFTPDYIFTPLNDHASRLPNALPPSPFRGGACPERSEGAGACTERSRSACTERRELCSRSRSGEVGCEGSKPLSMRTVSGLLKKYCRRAGLDPSRITVHTLRHTAAMLRKQVGDDLEQISAFLGHSSLAVTQIYLHTLQGQPDASWARVADLLGLHGD